MIDPLVVLVGLTMVVGLIGVLFPILPGLGLIWSAALAYGLLAGFGAVGGVAMALITAGLAVGLWFGLRIPQQSTAAAGVGVRAQLLSLGLAVVGFFAIPVAGAFIGFVAGILITQWGRTREWAGAWAATKTAIGSILRAAATQFAIGLGMVGVWLVWALGT